VPRSAAALKWSYKKSSGVPVVTPVEYIEPSKTTGPSAARAHRAATLSVHR
jgi:hypothetical protein